MNELFTMNETGRFIWENLSEKTNVEDLVAKLTDTYEISAEKAEADILLFLEKLDKL